MAKSSKNSPTKSYVSNPFSITFKGLGLLVDFAKTTFIALVILSVLGSGLNVISDIANVTQEQNQTNENSGIDDVIADRNISDIDSTLSTGLFVAAFGVTLFAFIVLFSTLFNALINGTVAAAANAATDKKEITLGQAIRMMTSRFGVLYLALLVATVRIVGGYLLFVIPGIRAQLRYSALPYIIMANSKIGSDEALEQTKNLYKGHLLEVFGIMTVGGIIPFVGSSLTAGGLAISHKQIAAYKAAGSPKPKTHWLNYLGFMLIALLFVFIGLILGIVYSVTN